VDGVASARVFGHVLVRVFGQVGLVEGGIPDLPITGIHLVGGCGYTGVNNEQIKQTVEH